MCSAPLSIKITIITKNVQFNEATFPHHWHHPLLPPPQLPHLLAPPALHLSSSVSLVWQAYQPVHPEPSVHLWLAGELHPSCPVGSSLLLDANVVVSHFDDIATRERSCLYY